MVHLIADKIIETLAVPFLDKITGIVKVLTYQGPKKLIKIPVAYNLSPELCTTTADLDEYCPNSKKRSIIYFEDMGTSLRGWEGNMMAFTSQLRLVCWLNYDMIGEYQPGLAALNLLKYIPNNMGNSDGLLGVWVDAIRQEPNDGGCFTKYTYKEEVSQYLTFPYDYVSFVLSVTFKLRKDCIEDIEIDPTACGLPLTWDSTMKSFDSNKVTFDKIIV